MEDEARALKVCALGNLVFVQLARTGLPLAVGMELCDTRWSALSRKAFCGTVVLGRLCKASGFWVVRLTSPFVSMIHSNPFLQKLLVSNVY